MIKFDPTIALHLFCVITFSHRPIFLIKMKIKKQNNTKEIFYQNSSSVQDSCTFIDQNNQYAFLFSHHPHEHEVMSRETLPT